jgi:hypothetical protein
MYYFLVVIVLGIMAVGAISEAADDVVRYSDGPDSETKTGMLEETNATHENNSNFPLPHAVRDVEPKKLVLNRSSSKLGSVDTPDDGHKLDNLDIREEVEEAADKTTEEVPLLPPVVEEGARKLVLNGDPVKLDELGPIIINPGELA